MTTSAEQTTKNLSGLSPVPNSKFKRKRVGKGEGSGNGKTCGKGQKGQRMRCGYNSKAGFEGGQMPLQRRLPKRGFVSRKRTIGKNVFELVSLEKLATLTETDITPDLLLEKGFVRQKTSKIKVLGSGKIDKKFKISVHAITESAKAIVEAAGGEVSLVA